MAGGLYVSANVHSLKLVSAGSSWFRLAQVGLGWDQVKAALALLMERIASRFQV
ncbi:MAG: hypothetical protein AAFQ44_00350 [Pseudomonadota bacterium]